MIGCCLKCFRPFETENRAFIYCAECAEKLSIASAQERKRERIACDFDELRITKADGNGSVIVRGVPPIGMHHWRMRRSIPATYAVNGVVCPNHINI